ncbi:MAG: hypothetical protein AB7S42_11570 [Lysobacteraceae bacterium]
MSTRIYAVYDERTLDTDGQRLVRAGTRAQALRHVAQDVFHVAVADQDDLVLLVGTGTRVEDATADIEEAAA